MQKYLMQCLAPYYYRGHFLKTEVERLFGHDVISHGLNGHCGLQCSKVLDVEYTIRFRTRFAGCCSRISSLLLGDQVLSMPEIHEFLCCNV